MAWEIAIILSVVGSMLSFIGSSFLITIDPAIRDWRDKDVWAYVFKSLLFMVGLAHIPLFFIVGINILNDIAVTGSITTLINLFNWGVVVSGGVIFAYWVFGVVEVYSEIKEVLDKRKEY